MKIRQIGFTVLALTLVAAFGRLGTVEAATQADILIAQANCNLGCDDTQTSCNGGCCILGGRLCGGRCINNCQTSATTCKSNCAASVIGAETSGAFFDTATIAKSGRSIRVGGPFVCPETATVDLEVALTQSGVGAVATGGTQFRCPVGGETTFAFDVTVDGNPTFLPLGAADACGIARIHARGGLSLDSFQWCREVTLVPAGVELQDD